jgi:hypothetical protein
MIKYIPSFLTSDEINYFMDIFHNEDKKYYGDEYYKFYFVDLMGRELEVKKFSNFSFKKFRVQMVDDSINQVEIPHLHHNPWSFIVFLNEDFTGGELIFDNNEFTPKVGDMVYFSGEEYHRVNNCVGKRYTLIGFMMNNPLDVESQRNFL